jgi:hypothetical protein
LPSAATLQLQTSRRKKIVFPRVSVEDAKQAPTAKLGNPFETPGEVSASPGGALFPVARVEHLISQAIDIRLFSTKFVATWHHALGVLGVSAKPPPIKCGVDMHSWKTDDAREDHQ